MYNATAVINTAIAALRDAKTKASDAQQGRLDAKLAILNADLIDRQQGLVQPNTRTNGLMIAEQVEGCRMSPAARTHDPETSHAAARSVQAVTLTQSRILDIIRDASVFGSGITDEGIIATYSRLARVHAWTMPSPSSIRSRRKELEDKRLVHYFTDDAGNPLFGKTAGGNRSHLWTVTS